ncbi:MAG: hypothetical protein QOF58_3621 [Pseudonocardiales bacterium]|jgi:hypothetical protein|nr:hypothetical protein [Pseudonocardiales bacterium]
MSAHSHHQSEVFLVRETTEIVREGRYTLVRYYRRGTDTFKVTIHRHVNRALSSAVAEIHTASQEWSLVVRSAPEKWHHLTCVWHVATNPAADPETGFANLRPVADEMACDAAAIVPA